MRVRPSRSALHPGAAFGPGVSAPGPLVVGTDRGSVVEPWIASGGQTEFWHFDNEVIEFAPEPNGVQLVAGFYIQHGFTGFLKEMFVAPCCPPQLGDPTEPLYWNDFVAGGVPIGHGTTRGSQRSGLWRLPLGWQSYFNPLDEAFRIPAWSWDLKLMQGDVLRGRPAFDITDPATWYLQLNIAVPASAYPQGLPGQNALDTQIVQVLPEEGFQTHVPIPENTTVLLFARWSQVYFQPTTVVVDLEGGEGSTTINVPYGDVVLPILPSVGRLHGFKQASGSPPAVDAAQQWR